MHLYVVIKRACNDVGQNKSLKGYSGEERVGLGFRVTESTNRLLPRVKNKTYSEHERLIVAITAFYI